MTIRLYGSTSGYVDLDAPAVAGSASVTLPGSGTLALTSALKVLQVVSTTKTDTFSTSVASGALSGTVTGLTAAITPASSSNKIFVSVNATISLDNTSQVWLVLYRDSTAIGVGDAARNRARVSTGIEPNDAGAIFNINFSYLDSPATTSSVTYSIQLRHGSGGTRTMLLNRSNTDTDSNLFSRGASTITAMEIA